MTKRATFCVWEIEHQGDVAASCDDLERAGCSDIKVHAVDYDLECMVIRCTLPAGVDSPSALNLKVAVL